MKISTRLSAILFSVLAAMTAISCDKNGQESGVKPEEVLGSFTYEGNNYNIRSVVIYELDNNQTQIWISETAGYTTVDEIEASVGELVITIQDSKIGQGKHTFEQEGNFVKYDSKVNSGWCTIKCDLDKESKMISFEFSSQKLKAAKNEIEGSYSGPYSEYTIADLENQWAYNRKAKDIKSVDYFEMEDGAPSRIVIYDDEIPAVEINLTPGNIGIPVSLGTAQQVPSGTEVFFDDGEEFKLRNSYGNILVVPSAESISISLKLTNEGGKTLAAEYEGAYRFRYGNKANRCIFDSGSEGYGYNGKFELKEAAVDESSNMITFRFTPGNHLSEGNVDMNMIPTLKISRNVLNEGELNLDGSEFAWEFYYHNFQVFSYDENTPDRPTASAGSTIEVNRDDNGMYSVNLELSTMVTKIETRNKLDEDGNVVMQLVPVYDELGNPVLDENDDPVMKEVPVTEQVEVQVPAKMDLFFNQAN